MLVAVPIVFIIAIVKTIGKKPQKKRWWFICFSAFALMITFELIAAAVECKHEWTAISESIATCTERGEIKYICNKCEREKTEYQKELGHSMRIMDRIEPTTILEGETTKQCERCGYEEAELIEKLVVTATSSSATAEQPISSPSVATSDERTETENEYSLTTEEINISKDAYLQEFANACTEIGLDTALITKWEQVDDWVNGEIFHFTYKRHRFETYINFDETISSINLGGTAIYKRGYEPYKVDDYLLDEDTAESLIPYAEDTVKLALNYPSTADFPLLDWSYGREGSLYQLKSSVKAKNGFGVVDEIPFTVIFDIGTEGKANCVYLQLDGVVVADERTPAPERKRVEIDTKSDDVPEGSIRLVDGELGEYGKQDPVYPEYVDYYLPVGRYKVKNNTKTSIVMIIDEDSNDELNRLTLDTGQSGEIEITAGQHIELTMHSDVTLAVIN